MKLYTVLSCCIVVQFVVILTSAGINTNKLATQLGNFCVLYDISVYYMYINNMPLHNIENMYAGCYKFDLTASTHHLCQDNLVC